MHPVESEMLCSLTKPTTIPYFNAPIYLENKTQIGKIDEILGPINEVYFTVKMENGMVASSFKKEDKVYIGGDKLLPIERFLPKPKVAGAKVESESSDTRPASMYGADGRAGRCPGRTRREGRYGRQGCAEGPWRAKRPWWIRRWIRRGPRRTGWWTRWIRCEPRGAPRKGCAPRSRWLLIVVLLSPGYRFSSHVHHLRHGYGARPFA
jgi:H/ACA ribonucleoprotein complex subunit 1